MDSTAAPPNPNPNPKNPPSKEPDRDLLYRVEAYLAKRDGVDKLLKISRYAAKLILASSVLRSSDGGETRRRLKAFESSVGVSRKAFRLGKFVQDLNALRKSHHHSKRHLLLSVLAYGGEGLYYFLEQFVWLAKSGLIDPSHARSLQKVSAWAEFVGYVGNVSLKVADLAAMAEEEVCLRSTLEIAALRGASAAEEEARLRKLREKKLMKMLSVVQDLADAVMAVDDILDGKSSFSNPVFMASAGLLSALISTHKNWLSC
ncbi:hypothetical protein Fmac_032563 [Flemingia macrophylla]|uniref:Peroxisomal membrane protein 11A n=1 Tax=Flemingia macrophylla TaxID=520843 RepID=A0ABD1L5A9_9FABA